MAGLGGIQDREFGKFRAKDCKPVVATTHHASGSIEHVNGIATTTAAEILSGNNIEDILVSVPKQSGNASLLVSFDGGSNFITVQQQGSLSASDIPSGQTSLHVKSSSGTINYEILLYREA